MMNQEMLKKAKEKLESLTEEDLKAILDEFKIEYEINKGENNETTD